MLKFLIFQKALIKSLVFPKDRQKRNPLNFLPRLTSVKNKGFWELAPADERIIPTAVSKAPFYSHKQSTFQKECPLYSLLPASSVSLLLTAYPETSMGNQQIARMYLCSTVDLCVYSNFSYWVIGALYQNTAYKKENVLLGNTQHLALNLIVSSP